MALVCDIKSNNDGKSEHKEEDVDLEDGEIEDDEEETAAPVQVAPVAEITPTKPIIEKGFEKDRPDRPERPKDRDRSERRRHEEKGKKHMTEAEKSILHLRKREEMQRKKWEKFNRNKEIVDPLDDDFAKNIEKTLATILSKKEKEAAGILSGGESTDKDKDKDKDEEKRGRKRRKNDRDMKRKQRRLDSPPTDGMDEDMLGMNNYDESIGVSPSQQSDESGESEYASDRSKGDERMRRRGMGGRRGGGGRSNREHGNRNKNKDRKNDMGHGQMQQQMQTPMKDSQGVCVFYLQGKCQQNDCPYSHEAVPPMKLELCKFYMMDCCAKGDKCSYMHSEFPCKFYHTGLTCAMGDNCKFSHGKALSEGLKQILFKHIETAPRDILGGFPRMSREEALDMIDATQCKLREGINEEQPKGGIPSLFDINVPIPPELMQGIDDKNNKQDKPGRNRPSRWQDMESQGKDLSFPTKTFIYGQDQDMRINSNGDVDMRKLPPPIISPSIVQKGSSIESSTTNIDLEKYKREAGLLGLSSKLDVDIRKPLSMDIDIRIPPMNNASWPDNANEVRTFSDSDSKQTEVKNASELTTEENSDNRSDLPNLPPNLPKTQRELFMRIHAQQKESSVETNENKSGFEVEENINWYSDDDDEDDDRLTIKVDGEDVKEKEEVKQPAPSEIQLSPPIVRPQEVVERLGDLSKIDISAEVIKLFSNMSQNRPNLPTIESVASDIQPASVPTTSTAPSDPRVVRADPRTQDKQESPRTDPRQRSRQGSTETATPKIEKMSIYEQGSIDRSQDSDDIDIDIRGTRSDVDLRSLQLPFAKGGALLRNYTPATEIDASIASHPPIIWRVAVVEIPRPDYTGLKLNAAEAEKTGDPRLRKIFRLGSSGNTEERDTPLSPKASPKGSGGAPRADPRLRKLDDSKSSEMNFNQQLNILQSSTFYQSLTSTQKLLLNQELNLRNDSSNQHDPVLNSLLSNLKIIPQQVANSASNPNVSAAMSILTNITKMNNPMLGSSQPVNPSILGQNPNLMNQMAQSIAQPGLLGAAPGIPNLPPDFSMNFDPRNGGLLGNAPMPPFGGSFPGPDGPGSGGNFNNFNDDYFPPNDSGGPGHGGPNHGGPGHGGPGHGGPGHNFPPRDNMRGGFNRDRRRGRNNFNNRNNGGNRNFRRNNRPNRTHSPP